MSNWLRRCSRAGDSAPRGSRTDVGTEIMSDPGAALSARASAAIAILDWASDKPRQSILASMEGPSYPDALIKIATEEEVEAPAALPLPNKG